MKRRPTKKAAPADQQRRGDLARIHMLKDALGLDRDTYEDILVENGHQRSSADMDSFGRQRVITQLEYLLSKKDPAHPQLRRRPGDRPGRPVGQLSPQMKKIEALLADAKREWAYGHSVAERVCGGVTRLEWCNPAQLGKVIAALQIDANRRADRKPEGSRPC